MFNRIQVAINNWNALLAGAVQFDPKTPSDTNFVLIWRAAPDRPNTSEIGFRDIGVHQVRLHDDQTAMSLMGDWTLGIVQHELGHALGLYHEHVRTDRDQFLTINWGQVPSELYPEAWDGLQIAADSTLQTPYDYASVMHYHSEWRRPNVRIAASVRDSQGNVIPWIGGTITATAVDGSATRIDWDNGVVLQRTIGGASPTVAPAYFGLGGTWQSSVGAEYFFTQFGAGFTWRAPSLGQFGEGIFFGQTPPSEFTRVSLFVDVAGNVVNPIWANISPLDVQGVRMLYA